MKAGVTATRLRELLRYDAETGKWTWLTPPTFRVKVGGLAGSVNGEGYRQIQIDGRVYLAHRLAWFYVTDEWPTKQIDHINRDRSDNRWENLREATPSQNRANSSVAKNNTSGAKGVSWIARDKVWRARGRVAGRPKHLGDFRSLGAAAAAYERHARKTYGQFASPSPGEGREP